MSIVQVCLSRTIGNKDQCVQQISMNIEQGELKHCNRLHGLQMEERYIRLQKMNSTTDSKTSKMALSFQP